MTNGLYLLGDPLTANIFFNILPNQNLKKLKVQSHPVVAFYDVILKAKDIQGVNIYLFTHLIYDIYHTNVIIY